MRNLLRSSAALALLLPGSRQSAEVPRFHVASGAVLEKNFVTEGKLVLEKANLLAEGEWTDLMAWFGPLSVQLPFRLELGCTDHYVHVSGGRPTELLRTLDTVQARVELEGWTSHTELWEFDGWRLEGRS